MIALRDLSQSAIHKLGVLLIHGSTDPLSISITINALASISVQVAFLPEKPLNSS